MLIKGKYEMADKRRGLKEAKAARRKKRRRARRMKRAFFLIGEVLVLMMLLVAWYIVKKYDKMQINPIAEHEIQINEGAEQEGYTTIALFGGDSRDGVLEAGTHADTIMIVSIDNKTKDVRVVSVYRDTLMEQADGELKKANSAYFMDGPKAAINMLNKNLDLDIKDYVTVDFKALADVVDLLGGIEINVEAQEAEEANKYIEETSASVGKPANLLYEGTQKLDGVQTVTYARIRKNVGGDYKRTERQRLVIQKIVEEVQKSDLGTIDEIINQTFSQVSTSFSLTDMLGMAGDVFKYELGETKGFPFESIDGRVEGVGSVVVPLGMEENVMELHEFLYPKDEYSVSDTVKSIGNNIEYVSGYSREDYTGE